MRRFATVIFMALMLSGTVAALYNYQVYDNNIDSYGGQIARDRRIYDPYTRNRYYGDGYIKPFINFGRKGPTDRLLSTGQKSAFSPIFNLDTTTLSNQGRDPGHISNWDPEVRGYTRLDRSVALLPYTPTGQVIGTDPSQAKGTARIYSTGNMYGAGNNQPHPDTQVFIQTVNMQPLAQDEMYYAWLYDDETEYALNLGILRKGVTPLTGQLVFEFPRLAHMFDEVWITKEPFPSSDPNPHEIILSGRINPARKTEGSPPDYYTRLR